ncbi:hypothetical protein CHS0354_024553 [Potamilus streckersoni]|uniref:Vacuolar protein sorting-associated protein 18 homolog n=1 Tax=Potamilus streckersoni TaxID=2493646 RepID=A0AAE0TNQ4_9BIVA|nr:hypothetical protein CHS0354_024553 [Potamilus streckersoni]
MASIFDQYERAQSSTSSVSGSSAGFQEPLGPGFIDARLQDIEIPVFQKKKINFKPEEPVTHLVVCNNFLVMAMSNGQIMRLDLDHPDGEDKVEIHKSGEDKVYKLFLDPTGRHLIISMESQENVYLSRNSKKTRSIAKLKGHLIESVGWNWQNVNDNTTGAILLGTSKGLIFESELTVNEDTKFWQGSLDQYMKQLYQLTAPVTGIEFDRMPSESLTEYQYFILATTPSRLYQFIGGVSKTAEPPMFGQMFQQNSESDQMPFLELPGDIGNSTLQLYFPRFRGPVKSFAWMTGPGVYYGIIDLSGKQGPYSVTCDTQLMRYPKEADQYSVIHPRSMVLTEFHVLLLFYDRIKAFCLLNEQLIFDEPFPERFGKLTGICKDPLKGNIWVFTPQNIFKYKVTREDRDVWQMYLDKQQFEMAKEYCKDNPVHMDKVLTKQAEHLLSLKRYAESAQLYALTQNSFEEIALKFIRLQEKDPLRSFLHKKLESLKPQDKTKMTMLVTWLIEIYLNQLGELKEQNLDSSSRFKSLQQEFQTFLKQTKIKECISHNRTVVYDMIASHGDVVDLIFFAVLMQDYEKVINQHIQYDEYKTALETLVRQSDPELYYKFTPILMQYIPKDTVTALIHQGKNLDPKKLIPALVQYDQKKHHDQGNEVIRYLEFCIEDQGNQDQAIHNYLLSLYAETQPDKLMTYLHLQGQDPENISYDVKFALRQCSEHGHLKESVHIYSLMGLYEEAVDLALQVDVELAKQQADKPEEDDVEMRKKLWLRIARHVVEEEKDVKRAMEFLHECDLLKIEDVLPFFPDFVTIDHFKDAIVTSLQEYNQHIDRLKEEMDEATQSAEEIRKEIQGFRNKYAQVKANDKCSTCGFPLMSRAFYLFPCQHKFHSDCLIAEVLPNLGNKIRTRVEELQRKIAERDESRAPTSAPQSENVPVGKSSEFRAELDDLIASECIYCGEFMVKSIDKLFFDETDQDAAMSGWL